MGPHRTIKKNNKKSSNICNYLILYFNYSIYIRIYFIFFLILKYYFFQFIIFDLEKKERRDLYLNNDVESVTSNKRKNYDYLYISQMIEITYRIRFLESSRHVER